MKIAILSPFYPFRGGLAQLNARLYTELSKSNEVKAFTFTTLYPGFLFPGKTQFVSEGDTATEIDSIRVLSSVNPLTYFKTARKINDFLPDVLIIPYWMSFLAPAFGSVCRLINRQIKVVSLVHNAISHERTFVELPLAKYFFNACDAFIVMSEPVKKDLLSIKEDAKILLQPHPIYDHYKDKIDKKEARQLLSICEEKKTLLFFGFIRDYKGLDLLIQATNFLSGNDYQLIIAGEVYGSFDKYQALIEKSSLKDNIKVFNHYINDDMVSVLFSAADLLVLPYRSATQSGVVAIAYQLEIPMVVTDVGALGDTVRDADTGLVAPDISPESIADTIKGYFSMDTAHFIENLKAEKKRLSWASFIRDIEKFIKENVLR